MKCVDFVNRPPRPLYSEWQYSAILHHMQPAKPRSRKKWLWLLTIPGLAILVILGYNLMFYFIGWGVWPWQLQPIGGQPPQFITHQYIDLSRIQQVSKFRSGVGHDASDSFESCRSMKHYFSGDESEDRTTIELYAPMDGKIVLNMSDDPGHQVWIRPSGYPQYLVIIYHAKLINGLGTGTTIRSGMLIGHLGGNTSWSDMQIAELGFFRHRFISYFDVMTDQVFSEFQDLGFASRQDFILSKSERDARPLRCGFGFFKTGSFIEEDAFEDAYVLLRKDQFQPEQQNQPGPSFPTIINSLPE